MTATLPPPGGRWRPLLRAAQVAVAVWTTWVLTQLLLAPPAAADNCSVFTDCFGVANSAVEAAFGLSLLAALSIVLDFVPFVGTGKGVLEAVIGRDLLTGEELAGWERALGVLPFVGAGVGVGAVALRHGDLLGDLGRGTGHLDPPPRTPGGAHPASGPGRPVPPPPPPVPPTPGAPTIPRPPLHGPKARAPLDPAYQPLVAQYATAGTAQRKLLSEQLGEAGGLQYLQDAVGDVNLPVMRPATDADVADLVDAFYDGRPWDRAIAYGGSRATNLLHYDGTTLRIVEAKGGAGRYGDRIAGHVPTLSGRITQTHPQYPRDVAYDMLNSTRADGRNDIGALIEDAYDTKSVEYVGVRTGTRTDFVSGSASVELESVFLRPTPPAAP